ncbi:lamin tail domain-containing protein, partial [Candidatus Bathyarchaeota archaeon]|nr:lamin tail domain-containing protein [Candidatus Bathyarchaeota archaeon]
GVFESYLVFDGNLENVVAYDASISLGCNTFNDNGGTYTASWMDANYEWSDPSFKNRCGESLNLATNYVADVLHTLYMMSTRSGNDPLPSQVVINEFEQNPLGPDDGYEWVELYNPTTSTVDISSWTLSTTHGIIETVTIPSNTFIEANGYYICQRTQQWLDNIDESIILRNADGVEIDKTLIANDEDNDNYNWARYPNGYDTNSSSDWRFQPATKGASNGKAPSSISCGLSSTSLEIGSSVTVSGSITPTRFGVTVTLSYTMPNATPLTRTAISASDGKYSDTYTPSVLGSWSVKASWTGDGTYSGAESSIVSFTITPIEFLISFAGTTYKVHINTNSTVSSLVFNQTLKQISFNVTGLSATIGYCNVTIPMNLLGGTLTLLLDGTTHAYTLRQNSTHSFIYFNYSHSTHTAQIIGTIVVPEFPTIMSTTILLAILSVTLIFTQRRMISMTRLERNRR